MTTLIFNIISVFLILCISSCISTNRHATYTGSVIEEVYIIKDYPDDTVILTCVCSADENGNVIAIQRVKPGTKFLAYNMRQDIRPNETCGSKIDFRVKIRVNGIDYDIPARFNSSNIKEIDINTYLKFDQP